MKHFVVIANAYKDRNFALTNKIVTYIEQKGGTAKGLMSNVEAISTMSLSLRIYHRIRSVFLCSAVMVP